MTIRLVLLAATALTLNGCGRQGQLERPAPLFGERARAEYEAERNRPDAPDETSQEENEQDDAEREIPDSQEGLRPRTNPNPGS